MASDADVPSFLEDGALRVLGRMPWSSNATLLCEIVDGDEVDDEGRPVGPAVARAIYKPHAGERPLWDFPDGLYRREVAAYRLSRALGWDLIPPTVERDGPFGIGSVQLFVDADFEQHYFLLLQEEDLHPQLRRIAAFDIVANSTDRKGGHVLRDGGDRLWAIDNGLCLHAEWKLRTVIWDFGGEHLPAEVAEGLGGLLDGGVTAEVAEHLDAFEVDALLARTRALLESGRFPTDPTGRRVPWPLV